MEELCDKVTNADSCRKRKRTNSSSVKVPRQCRVRSVCFISFNLAIEETFFPDVFYGKNVLTLFKLKFKLSFVLYCDGMNGIALFEAFILPCFSRSGMVCHICYVYEISVIV